MPVPFASLKTSRRSRPVHARAFFRVMSFGLPMALAGCSATDFGGSAMNDGFVQSLPAQSLHSAPVSHPSGSHLPDRAHPYTAPHFESAQQRYRPQAAPSDGLLLKPWDRFENPSLRVLQETALRNSLDPNSLLGRVSNAKRNRQSSDPILRDHTQLRRDLLKEVALLSAEIHRSQRLLLMAVRNRERQTEGLDQANVRMQVGAVGRLEVEQFQSMLSQTMSSASMHHQSIEAAVRRLRDLVGQPLTGAIVNSLNDHPQLHLRDVDSKLPAQILRQRCDVRSAEEKVVRLGRQAGIPEAELYPHLGLTGEIRASEQPPLGQSKSKFDEALLALDGSALGIDLGSERSWQFMTPATDLGQSSRYRTPLQQSMGGYHHTVTVAADEVKRWLSNYIHTRRRIETLRQATADAEETLRLLMQQFQADRVKAGSVVTAQQQLMGAEEKLIDAEYQLAVCAVELFIAVGGQCYQDRFPQAELYEKGL